MSGFTELRSLGVTVRPLAEPKPPPGNHWSQFRASLTSTVAILASELRSLEASRIVIELDLRERDIRADGLPRADARPTHDGVALAFESKFGPLRYATAEFSGRWGEAGWEANLRAIALSMRALRAVDRYGVSRRGEQYQGWRALPERATGTLTREQAERFIEEHGGSYREAARLLHPDAGGDEELFKQLTQAQAVIEATS